MEIYTNSSISGGIDIGSSDIPNISLSSNIGGSRSD